MQRRADTLAWARRGAIVTGVDFSDVAITEARRLAAATGIDATFVCADLYRLSVRTTSATARRSCPRRPPPTCEAPPDFAAEPGTEHGWLHPLGEIVTALCRALLRIEYLHEWPDAHFRMLPSFERAPDGRWRPPPGTRQLPLTFSLLASRASQ